MLDQGGRGARRARAGTAWAWGAALTLTHISCDLQAPPAVPLGGAGGGAAGGEGARLTLLLDAPPLTAPERGRRWAAEVREAESGLLVRRERLAGALSARVTLSPLPPASYVVTVFLEGVSAGLSAAEGAPRYHPCPSPPSPRDALFPEAFDAVVGVWRGALGGGAPLGVSRGEGALEVEEALALARLSCGPGGVSTSLSGEVTWAGAGAGAPAAPALALWLEALDADADVRRAAFALPLHEAPGEAGRWRFTLTQVPAGRYRATAFEDSDGDGRLTPCAPPPPPAL
ncbi:MAG: hypothetical protein FJ138_16580, partial [Deltaproteobacteria bacterium]|nr:hypothetical protein [Deltaproteobacteria bacterium]